MITNENKDYILHALTKDQLNGIEETSQEYCLVELQATNNMSWVDIELSNDFNYLLESNIYGGMILETSELRELIQDLKKERIQ